MDEEVETMAQTTALALQTAVQHEGDLRDPGSWVTALRKLGARVQRYRDGAKGASAGFFVADELGGIIYYNAKADPFKVCLRLCHEGSHFYLAQYKGSGLRRVRPEQYDDRRQSKQHRAARRVEEILLGEQ